MGRFHDARQLYNECLASHQDRFLVLAEYGYCLLQGGSYGRFIHEITPARLRDPKERETILFTLAGLTDRKEMAVILLMRLYAEYASGVSNYDYYNESLEKNESIDETIFLYERYSKDLNNRGVKRIITMAKTMSLLWADTGIDLSSLSYTDTEIRFVTLYLETVFRVAEAARENHKLRMSLTANGEFKVLSLGRQLPLTKPGDFIQDWCSFLIKKRLFWEAQHMLQYICRASSFIQIMPLVKRLLLNVEREVYRKEFLVAISSFYRWLLREPILYNFFPHKPPQVSANEALLALKVELPSTDDVLHLTRYISESLKLDLKLPALEGASYDPLSFGISIQAFREFSYFKSECPDVLKEVQAFIDTGGDVNFRDKFDCPLLHLVCETGDERAVQLLLKAGADLEAHDRGGGTALHRAMHHKSVSYRVALLLIEKGLSLNATDNAGRTVLDWAGESDSFILPSLLQKEQELPKPRIYDTSSRRQPEKESPLEASASKKL